MESYYEIQFQPATENYQYAWFAQDNWKVTPKLTLNLGLRYDVSLPRTDRLNHQNWFDPNAVNPLNGGTITYQDPLTGQNVTRPLLGGEVFANSQSAHELCDRLERHSAALRLRLPVRSEDGVAGRLWHLLRPVPVRRQRSCALRQRGLQRVPPT